MKKLTMTEKKWLSYLLYTITIVLVCFLAFSYKGHFTKDLNSAQTIYTVIFSIYFAVTISTTRNLQLFDTPNFKYPKTRRRLFYSLFFVNFVPLLFFWITLRCLSTIPDCIIYTNFFVLAVVFLQSIIGFGIYRVYFGILISKDEHNEYYLYDQLQYPHNKNAAICFFHRKPQYIFIRNMGKQNDYKYPIDDVLMTRPENHKESISHIFPGLLWVFVTISSLFIMMICLQPIL